MVPVANWRFYDAVYSAELMQGFKDAVRQHVAQLYCNAYDVAASDTQRYCRARRWATLKQFADIMYRNCQNLEHQISWVSD